MNTLKQLAPWKAALLTAALVLPVSAGALAQTSESAPPQGDDCGNLGIDYEDDPLLTKAEKLAKMEQAFYESLSRSERCLTSSRSQGAGSGGAGSGAPKSGGKCGGTACRRGGIKGSDSADGAGGEEAVASTPSQHISGTEKSDEESGAGESSDPAADDPGTTRESAQPAPPPPNIVANGKVPEDIPPEDNDTILQAQIRARAMAETDPEKREKLWDEYRKYRN